MLYPLYDFKKKDNNENSNVIEITERGRDLLFSLNKVVYKLTSKYKDLITPRLIGRSLKQLTELHKQTNDDLLSPTFTISTVGTTCSGKSTFVNALLGEKLSPMNADELSVGTLKFIHNANLKEKCKLSVTTLIANKHWENGDFIKSNEEAYYQIKDTMETYRREVQSETLSPPHITARSAFFAGNHPEYLSLDKNVKMEVLELPWMIVDSESFEFIHEKLKASMVIFLIDYTVLFNKETRETNMLFNKLMEIKKQIGNTAILFVINKVDLRNFDDDSLDVAIHKCQLEIQKKMNLPLLPDIVTLNSLLMYYSQCALTAYENGGLKDYKPEDEETYDDTKKMFISIIRDNLKKCMKDQAKAIAEIQDSKEENVDLVYEIQKALRQDKIPAFDTFEKFWQLCLEKSGAKELFEKAGKTVNSSMNELILYVPMHKITFESHRFFKLLEENISLEKKVDLEKLEDAREFVRDVYESVKQESGDFRNYLDELIKDNMAKLRKPDTKLRNEAINDLDIGQVQEITTNIKQAVDNEAIIPVKNAFIHEMRPDSLTKKLVEEHGWKNDFAAQLVEHFDFLRMKLYNETKYIEEGRKFELFEEDVYEKDKIREINKHLDLLCKNLIKAVEEKLKFEMQIYIDELSVRINRWLNKKTKEMHEKLNKVISRLDPEIKLKYITPEEITGFKHEYTFLDKLELAPSKMESTVKVKLDRFDEPTYKRVWYTLWMMKVRDTITKEKDVIKFDSVEMQAISWSNSVKKLERELWNIICDTLDDFFAKAIKSYEAANFNMLEQAEEIFGAQNQKVSELEDSISDKWDEIQALFNEGTAITRNMAELIGLPVEELPEPEENLIKENKPEEETEAENSAEIAEETVEENNSLEEDKLEKV